MKGIVRWFRTCDVTTLMLAVVFSLCSELRCVAAGEGITIMQFTRSIQNIERKDFYLCLESLRGSGFLERRMALDDGVLPSKRGDLIALLRRVHLQYEALNDVIIIRDDALETSPLDEQTGTLHTKNGVAEVIANFGVGFSTSRSQIQRGSEMTLDIKGPVTLREALAQMARKYHCEWLAVISPPSSARSTARVTKEARVDIVLPKGLVELSFETGNWQKIVVNSDEAQENAEKSNGRLEIETLMDLCAVVQQIADKDYHLCAETLEESEFLSTRIALYGRPTPRTRREITELFDRTGVPYGQYGNVIVVEDPQLEAMGDYNPLRITLSQLHVHGGLGYVIGRFHVGFLLHGDFRRLFGKIQAVSLEIDHSISLRDALVEVTRRYGLEWIAEVKPAGKEETALRTQNSQNTDGGSRGSIQLTLEAPLPLSQ